jgi:hypothetical protein
VFTLSDILKMLALASSPTPSSTETLHGGTAETVKLEMAEATGIESAPSEPPEWATSGADLGLPHGLLNDSSLAIVA